MTAISSKQARSIEYKIKTYNIVILYAISFKTHPDVNLYTLLYDAKLFILCADGKSLFVIYETR